MKKLFILISLLTVFTTQAATLICLAKDGEELKDAAFAIELKNKKMLLQGSKFEYFEDSTVFEGLALQNINISSSRNSMNVSAQLMGFVTYKFSLSNINDLFEGQVQYQMNDELTTINLECESREKIELVVL